MKKIILCFSLLIGCTLTTFAQKKHQKEDVWIDRFDFEGPGSKTYNSQTLRGEKWITFTDAATEGGSVLDSRLFPVNDAVHGKVMEIKYTLSQGQSKYPPYVGTICMTQAASYPKHIVYVAYDFKGPYHYFVFATSDITNYNYFKKSVPASTEWTTVLIPLSELKQEPDNGQILTFDPNNLSGLEWLIQGKDGEKGSLIIDNIRFVYTPIESKNYDD